MSKGYDNNSIDGDMHVVEQLSAYIDGQLSGDEREGVRAHIDRCADCRAGYIELRATQKLLQQMPVVLAPRAFTLTSEMVAAKPSLLRRIFSPRAAPKFAMGSALAFVLLFMLVSVNLLETRQSAIAPSRASSGLANNSGQSESSTSDALAPSGQAAPQVAATAPTATADAPANGYSGYTDTTNTGDATEEPTASANADQGTAKVPASSASAPAASPNQSSVTTGNAEAVDTPTAQRSGLTANTQITHTGTSSPTTTTLNQSTPEGAGGATAGQPAGRLFVTQTLPSPQAAPVETGGGWSALAVAQIGLLAVGLALAVAAVIARRQG